MNKTNLSSSTECPNNKKHTKSPEGQLQWHFWAEKKAKTHHQIKCDGCGLFVIWVKGKHE